MGRRVLLADDSVAIHRVVNLTFTGENVEVIAVNNGNDAVRLAAETRPDVVIADIFMPGLSGYEVCEVLHRQIETKEVPVILLVGAFESFDEGKAKSVGATAHMTKPIEPQSLLKLVNGLLDKVQPSAEANRAKEVPVIDRGKLVNGASYQKHASQPLGVRSVDLMETADSGPAISKAEKSSKQELNGSDISIDLTDRDYKTPKWDSESSVSKNDVEPMESFISSLETSQIDAASNQEVEIEEFVIGPNNPTPVFNQPEPPAVDFFGEAPAAPKLFVPGAEEEVIDLDEEAPQDEPDRQFNPNNPLGIDTGELESVVEGLGALLKPAVDQRSSVVTGDEE